MALLAYDPDRVGRLHLALAGALTGLQSLSCDDPAAADAIRAVEAFASELEFCWLPLAHRLLATDPLSPARQRDLLIDALDQALVRVMADGYGWSVQTDVRSDDTSVVTAEEARALGARLDDISAEALLDDPQQLRHVAQQLEVIGSSTTLSAEFLANFRGWAHLCDVLGGRRALLLGEVPSTSTSTAADLDAVFAGLAHVQRTALRVAAAVRCVPAAAVIPQMELMNPYSAALLVRFLGLDSATLAQVADQLLVRWRTMSWQRPLDAPPSDFDFHEGPNTADILFRTMLLDPVACEYFVLAAARHPDVLFAAATDPTLAHAVVLAATHPSRVTAAEAGAAIVPILDYFEQQPYALDAMSEGYDRSWELFLVDLIAPWTMQFSPLDNTWGLNNERQRDLLAFVIDDERALSRLLQQADVVRDGVLNDLATQGAGALEAFAAYFGLLHQLVVNETVQDEEEALAAFEFVVGVSAAVLARLPGLGVAARLLIGGVTKALVAHAPFDPAKAAHDAHYLQEYTLTVTAAAVATAVAQGWLQQGTLAPGFPMPPVPDPAEHNPAAHFVERFGAWLQQLPGGADGELADHVARLTYAFVGPAGAGGALAT